MSIDLNEVFTKGAAPYYRLFRGKPGTAGSQAFSGYQTVGWQRSKSPYNPLKPFMKGRHSLQHTASYDSITEAQYDAYVKPYMEQPSGYYLRHTGEPTICSAIVPLPFTANHLVSIFPSDADVAPDFRARQLAMAVEAGVTSEVVWALNALQLISFSLKDTWQQGAGPLSKAPQLLSALVSV
ncbi:unnamed protein product, partial [Closterium sp. NIES-53]